MSKDLYSVKSSKKMYGAFIKADAEIFAGATRKMYPKDKNIEVKKWKNKK